jgi:hypothetical protein
MSTTTAVIVSIATVVIVFAIAWFATQRRRRKLQDRFGPEYSRTVEAEGSRTAAEARLERLQRRVEAYHVRPLPPAARGRYLVDWKHIQAEFVDNPQAALDHAQWLIDEVMEACGYPVADFEQRSAELAVHHAAVVDTYRAAHEIAARRAPGEIGTEEQRQAMIHYRALFEDLVGEPEPAPTSAQERRA